jgi:hypothetical protein
MENLDTSLKVWIWMRSVLFLINKSNSRWEVFWFSSDHGNGKWHLARTIYPSCEKPHTRYTASVRGPDFIAATHSAPRIKLITFFKERVTIPPLRFEGHFTTHLTVGVRMTLNTSLTWWKCNKHNSFTQNTSLSRIRNTCSLSQILPAHH